MKCSECMQILDPSRVWIIANYNPQPHVVNFHPQCLVKILGRTAERALGTYVAKWGWEQLELPLGPIAEKRPLER